MKMGWRIGGFSAVLALATGAWSQATPITLSADFADAPRNPKWAVTVRYKSNATLMHGMGGMGAGGDEGDDQNAEDQQPKKKKRRGLGDLLGVPHP